MQLRIPGPTPLPPSVRKAISFQMISHRGREFGNIIFEVTQGLKRLLKTEADVLVFPGSGTGGLESSILSASQKGLMCPPGVSIVALSSKAWGYYKKATLPKYYWDYGKAKEYLDRGQTPYTPNLPAIFGLREALKLIFKEGLENVFRRHREASLYVRGELRNMGLKLFVEDRWASPAVTSFCLSRNIEAEALLKRLAERHQVVLSSGQGELKGRIIRLAHTGYFKMADLVLTLKALRVELGC